MNPRKNKRIKSTDESENKSEASSSKSSKSVGNHDAHWNANLVTAWEEVSYKAHVDHKGRFLLVDLPSCIKRLCAHTNLSNSIKVMPQFENDAIMIDVRANKWCEALECCATCITSTQYLSANVLKEVIKIMLNAHENENANMTVSYVISKCKQILLQHFSIHPPCIVKHLRLCYRDFLTSPLDPKGYHTPTKTSTNQNQFGQGVVKYCMNRLEFELNSNGSLVDEDPDTPEEMLSRITLQEDEFEIFDLLERKDRIDRLMTVLESIIELLQFDLAIWNFRLTNTLCGPMLKSYKLLMSYVLWSNNLVHAGTVNDNCRQILKIFTQLVHLKYPEKHIKIMTIWLNAVIQTFQMYEFNSFFKYPNIGKYSSDFAEEFYEIIGEMPHDSIIRILETIKPTYMKNLIGTLYLQQLLSTEEECVIKILIDFINDSSWNNYPAADSSIQIKKKKITKPRKINNKMSCLSKKNTECCTKEVPEDSDYPKMPSQLDADRTVNRNDVVQTLYITLDSYLDAYSLRDVTDILDNLNELDSNETKKKIRTKFRTFFETKQFAKKCCCTFQNLEELVRLFQMLKSSGDFPDVLKIFENIDLLGL